MKALMSDWFASLTRPLPFGWRPPDEEPIDVDSFLALMNMQSCWRRILEARSNPIPIAAADMRRDVYVRLSSFPDEVLAGLLGDGGSGVKKAVHAL